MNIEPIEVIEGNLVDAALEGKVHVMFHCCNSLNTFGSGIALEIRERIPKAYEVDTECFNGAKEQGISNFGGFSFTRSMPYVFNLYGQYGYGGERAVNYGAFSASLNDALEFLSNSGQNDLVLGFPYKIASDRAGGDWDIIREIIEFQANVYSKMGWKFVFYRL